MAAGVEREAGVVAARRPVALVGDVPQIAVYGDADGLDAARRDRPSAYSAQLAIGTDAQHGNLVAASIGGDQIVAVAGDLERALRADVLAGSRAPSGERRTMHGHERAIAEPIERPDPVRAAGVVVHVDMPHHPRRGPQVVSPNEPCRD